MKVLDIIDLHDYDNDYRIDERYAARAIIMKDNNIFMVHSNKGEYKFPGGGIKENESAIDALIREVREEAGLIVVRDSIKEYGEIIEKRKSSIHKNTIFIHHSYYYLCVVEDIINNPILDEYEQEECFKLKEISIYEAYQYNKNSNIKHTLRENRVLELLLK